MSKFKVGDKVAPVDTPNVYFGCIASIGHGSAFVKIPPYYESGFVVRLASLTLYQEIPDMSDDEIYTMLKPKLESMCIRTEYHTLLPTVFELEFESQNNYDPYIPESDAIKAIALAYRSGYLRAKKGRPFKIGGEKE